MVLPMPPGFSASCLHCRQPVLEAVEALAEVEIRRLRDHLLGCPAALAACSPALPVFDRAPDILRQFHVESAPA